MDEFDIREKKTLIEQQQALSSYLDALFRDIPEKKEPDEVKQVEAEVKKADVVEPAVPSATPIVQETVELDPKTNLQPVVDGELVVGDAIYRPTSSFQVLFFKLGKLNVAVPLEKLSGILKAQEVNITTIPGYTDWMLGASKCQDVTTNIIDTAKLLVPEGRQGVVEDRRKYRYYILINDKQLGLGCHSVADVVTLEPEEVKWRENRSMKPWLAGTVIEKMCALMDVDGFIKMIKDGMKA